MHFKKLIARDTNSRLLVKDNSWNYSFKREKKAAPTFSQNGAANKQLSFVFFVAPTVGETEDFFTYILCIKDSAIF